MANSGTIFGSLTGGTGVLNIQSQTLATVTETELQQILTVNSSGTVLTTGVAVVSVPVGTEILGRMNSVDPSANAAKTVGQQGRVFQQQLHSAWTSSNVFANGRPFRVRVCGVVTPANNAANSLTQIIYLGATKGGTAIASTGANTGTQSSTQAGAFIIEARLIWDSVGQILYGQQWYAVAAGATPLYNTWKVISNIPTGVTAANLKFCASTTWANAAGGVVGASEMSLSAE